MISRHRFAPIAKLLLVVVAFAPQYVSAQDSAASDGTSPGTGASQLYEKALIEYNLGQVRAAYIHLKNALLNDPFLLSAHLLLGKIYLQLGQGEKAEKQLVIADGLGAHQSLTLIPLARAYLQQGKSQQLVDEVFPAGTLPEEDAELLALRGQAHLDLEQYYEAQRAFTQAWERNPNNINAIIGRVHVLLLKGDLSEADFYARRATEMAPQNPEVWYLRGRLSRSLGDIRSALNDFKKAAEVMPAYLPAWIAQVSALLDLGRLDEALKAANQARDEYPRDPRAAYLQAVVDARRGEADEAEEHLKQVQLLLSQLPETLIEGHAPSLLLAGMVSYGLQNWAKAKFYLSLYLEKSPDSVGPRSLLAQVNLDNGQTEEAVKLLEPAVALAPGNQQVLSLLAEAYLRGGQYIRASEYLRQALEAEEDNPILRTQRAVNTFGLGRRARAIEELGAIYETTPRIAVAGATLVIMTLKERRYDDAVAVSRKLLEESPTNQTYLNLYGLAEMIAGHNEAARWAFDLGLVLDWRFEPSQLNLAELDLREGKPDDARKRLEVLLARNPRQVGAMLMLARSFEAQGDHEGARDWAKRAVGADPSSVPLAVYLTDLLLKMSESEEALAVAESMGVRAPNPDDIDLIAALSRAYLANGQKATAQVALQKGSGLAGYDPASLLEIAMLQRRAGDVKGAIWSLEKAVKGQPNYLPARVKLGELYSEIGEGTLAGDVAASLRKDFPDEPFGDHLAGVIAQARGDQREALSRFRAAFSRQPSSLLAIRVYEAMLQGEDEDAALEFLSRWIAENPDDRVAGEAYAEALYRVGRNDDAKQIYQRALAESPDNPLLLNNLALIYVRDRRPEAVDFARKAYELRPGAAEIADTLGWVLVLNGELDKGLKYLRDAQTRSADSGGIGYHLAYALEQLGRHDEAFREVEQALARGGDFIDRDEALELSRRLRVHRPKTASQQGAAR